MRTLLSGRDRLPARPQSPKHPLRAFPKRADPSPLLKVQRSAGSRALGQRGVLAGGPAGQAVGRGCSGSPCRLGVPSRAPRPAFCFGKMLSELQLCSGWEQGGVSWPHLLCLPSSLFRGLWQKVLCKQKPLFICVCLFLSRCLLLLFLLGIQHFEHGLHAGHESRSRVAMATSWALRAGEHCPLPMRTW